MDNYEKANQAAAILLEKHITEQRLLKEKYENLIEKAERENNREKVESYEKEYEGEKQLLEDKQEKDRREQFFYNLEKTTPEKAAESKEMKEAALERQEKFDRDDARAAAERKAAEMQRKREERSRGGRD